MATALEINVNGVVVGMICFIIVKGRVQSTVTLAMSRHQVGATEVATMDATQVTIVLVNGVSIPASRRLIKVSHRLLKTIMIRSQTSKKCNFGS